MGMTIEQKIKTLLELYHYIKGDTHFCGYNEETATQSLETAIDTMRKYQKIPTEWVDIHDRLPEGNDTDRVLVCYDDGFITTHSVGCLRNTKDFVCEVAWMPLPKPYEPQESENDKGI